MFVCFYKFAIVQIFQILLDHLSKSIKALPIRINSSKNIIFTFQIFFPDIFWATLVSSVNILEIWAMNYITFLKQFKNHNANRK